MSAAHGEILYVFALGIILWNSGIEAAILQQPHVYEQHNTADLLSRGSYIGEQNPEYEYEEPVNKTHHNHLDDGHEDDDSEIDQGDSEISEERYRNLLIFHLQNP
ncbi:hypothetical protein GCK32_012084 [Trichostrongylus colubriformis]|uniref:Uncharacterized protein n=1 Tax=Trichostrongylus colubriformis TaxID=6319 RepID=A0AAN8G591_TRICO